MKLKQYFALGLILVSTWAHSNTWVKVEGHGRTEKEAKQDAFSAAIKQVVGQVIVSDRETNGDQLTKDFIGSYSAGYVDKSETLETHQSEDIVIVTMNVSVASSKIASRMLNSGNKSTIIIGQRLQEQLDSQIEQRNQGDQLLSQILDSYPYNAYVPNFNWKTEIDKTSRKKIVVITADITMSQYWIDAFNEAVNLVAVNSTKCNSLIRLFTSGRYIGNGVKKIADDACGTDADIAIDNNSYYFADNITLEMINDQLHPPIGVFVEYLDASGKLLDSRCVDVKTEKFIRYERPRGTVNWNEATLKKRPKIAQGRFIQEWAYIDEKNIIEDLAKIKLTVQRTCT